MKSKPDFVVALVAIAAGLALQTYQLLFLSEGSLNSFLVGLITWSIAPYVICGVVLFGFHRALSAAVAGCLVFAADLSMHYSVFVHPSGSTAAVGLVFMPMLNLGLFMPAGLVVGWLISKRAKSNAP